MVINRHGQFFLLAAVIISAVIISLGAGTNKVIGNEEPGSFYDFSYEVKREVGAVLDYEVYSGFDSSVNLTEFVNLLAGEIEERSSGSNFIFIYGNSTKMELKNYGSDSVYIDGVEVEGLNTGVTSRVCLKAMCQEIDESIVDFDSEISTSMQVAIDDARNLASNTNVTVEIKGNVFEFPTSKYRQVIFIMQKNVGDDRHIIVE